MPSFGLRPGPQAPREAPLVIVGAGIVVASVAYHLAERGWRDVVAHTVANDASHELNRPFALERFETGALIDEHGAAAVAH